MFCLKDRKLFIYKHPVTMLLSFDGLTGLITNNLKQNPMSGDVFVFFNNRRTKMKILTWETEGFVMLYKRLEKGTFENPALGIEDTHLSISHATLEKIITGKGQRKTRKRLPSSQQ